MAITIDEFLEQDTPACEFELGDYQKDTPRWCKGCGDHAVLAGMQRMLRDNQEKPENVLAVSGIGCSSRFPHYLRTYGFHTLHGRALPVTVGASLARPDLKLLTVMGDGDCFSIGGNHWLHTLRYNIDATVMVLDNEIYALTKKQVSPTSQLGTVSNTTPHGSYLKALNPLSVTLGITNISFVAQTATWLPGHMEATFKKAWAHKGLSFVRILQKCPVYMPKGWNGGQKDFPAVFLENENGIKVDKGILKDAPVVKHDHSNINTAQAIAADEARNPLGLLYYNPDVPTYGDIRQGRKSDVDRKTLVSKLDKLMDKYAVK
jgi:2-oxoglutarate ferredoxin oxidoreductase subunit beta